MLDLPKLNQGGEASWMCKTGRQAKIYLFIYFFYIAFFFGSDACLTVIFALASQAHPTEVNSKRKG